jgi:hypothetical protein
MLSTNLAVADLPPALPAFALSGARGGDAAARGPGAQP